MDITLNSGHILSFHCTDDNLDFLKEVWKALCEWANGREAEFVADFSNCQIISGAQGNVTINDSHDVKIKNSRLYSNSTVAGGKRSSAVGGDSAAAKDHSSASIRKEDQTEDPIDWDWLDSDFQAIADQIDDKEEKKIVLGASFLAKQENKEGLTAHIRKFANTFLSQTFSDIASGLTVDFISRILNG